MGIMGAVNTSYESEHTKWMREMNTKNPHWEADQLAGRALLWDKQVSPAEQETLRAARQPQKSYPYDVNFFGE